MFFGISMSFTPPVAALVLKGELDLHTAQTLGCGIEQAVGTGCVVVDVDLSEITFLDSAGIDALLDARSTLQAASSRLRVRQPSPAVSRLLRLTGVDELLGLAGPQLVLLDRVAGATPLISGRRPRRGALRR
jgi:anti-anti-sigma factor